MTTFAEYQALAAATPLSLRNDLDRIRFPASGLLEASGKISSLLNRASTTGRFSLTGEQGCELQDRLADLLWCTTLLCAESGMSLEDVAAHSLAQLQARAKDLDPDQR